MSKRTLTYILLSAFAGFAVAMLALIIFGRATHEEPVFMKVCWTDGNVTWVEGGLEEENRGSCAEPEELVWPKERLPLTVSAGPPDGAKWSQAMDDATKAAIDHINGQLGYTHFRIADFSPGDPLDRPHADIEVVFGAPFETGKGTTRADRAAASCTLTGRHDPNLRDDMRALIRLRDTNSVQLTHRILVHELGHCGLGLAHDPFKASIMYPLRAADEGEHLEFLRFTDTDREALRARYAP